MPIVKLLPVTARNYYNILLNKYEMVFDIVMWSENARKAVFDHLHKEGHAGPNGEGTVQLNLYLCILSPFVKMKKKNHSFRSKDGGCGNVAHGKDTFGMAWHRSN